MSVALPSPFETSSSMASFCRLLSTGAERVARAGAVGALSGLCRPAIVALGSRTGSWRTIVAPGGAPLDAAATALAAAAICCSRKPDLAERDEVAGVRPRPSRCARR